MRKTAKVLTSSENRKRIDEKERIKAEKVAEKERIKLERETKKAEKMEEKRRKEMLQASKGTSNCCSTEQYLTV